MKISFNKNMITSLLLLIITGVIVYRTTPVYVPKNLEVTISKNSTSISNIYQTRNTVSTHKVSLDRLNLYHKGKFGHPKMGNIAKASEDFFLDVDEMLEINKADYYQFLIGSDDGFTFSIDGKKICDHDRDRPYSIQPCKVFLNAGKHRVQISYFQGFGQSGFSVQYQTSDGKTYWFGENSSYLKLD